MILAWQIDLTFVVPALPRQPKCGRICVCHYDNFWQPTVPAGTFSKKSPCTSSQRSATPAAVT
jgi:hypothetical protein